VACIKIPYPTDQGTISAEQGILVDKEGISAAKLNSSPDDVFGAHKR
jgi:hypothetical protein